MLQIHRHFQTTSPYLSCKSLRRVIQDRESGPFDGLSKSVYGNDWVSFGLKHFYFLAFRLN